MLPVAHSFACFLSTRANEHIYNNATEKRRIIYTATLAGLVPGGPGHSHQSVRDISALAAIPNLVLAEPSSEAEVDAMYDYLVNQVRESAYLRLVSVKWPLPFAYPHGQPIDVGRGWVVREGADAIAFAYGPWLLSNAFEAADEIETNTGMSICLVNLPWLNRIDPEWLRQVIGSRRSIVTLDNHYLHGGQGEMLSAAIAALGLEPAARVTRVGLTELPECGTNDEVLAYHGLDVPGLVKSLRQAVPQVA
jgi:transketolase